MRVEQVYDPDQKKMIDHYIADPGETLMMTGNHVSGLRTLADGTEVNLTPAYIPVASAEQAAEIDDLIQKHYLDNGHPDDIDTLIDPETGADVPVQRPFVCVNSAGTTLTGVGTPVGEHPLDAVQTETKES